MPSVNPVTILSMILAWLTETNDGDDVNLYFTREF